MGDAGPRFHPVVLEDEDIAEALVAAQVEQAGPPGAEDVGDFGRGEVGQGAVVVGGFDDDLVGADAVHGVVEPHPPLVQLPLDAQRRVLVGDDPHPPAGAVGCAAGRADGEDLAGGLLLPAVAEGAGGHGHRLPLENEVAGPPAPIGGDDDPAHLQRIPAQFGH